MLTVKQIFELARDGAFEQYNFATKTNNFYGAHRIFQTVKEIQDIIETLDKKENYVASSNPATETAVLFALNLKEDKVQQLKAMHRAHQAQAAPSEYMVRIQLVSMEGKRPATKKFFSTLEAANEEFVGWKNVNENTNAYSVTLSEKTGEGQYKVLARSIPDGYTEEPKPQTKPKPAQLYQVRIIHLDGHEQVLRFPILAAAQATFELLKYELEVGRIRRAAVVKLIPSVGFKQELYHIGETEEEAIF